MFKSALEKIIFNIGRGLSMKTGKSINLDLQFKIPTKKDASIALKYAPLSPRKYLNLIEAGIKLLPDVEAAMKRHQRNAPTVRFEL